jgi:uncharacterized LabA/DUF88 family protein
MDLLASAWAQASAFFAALDRGVGAFALGALAVLVLWVVAGRIFRRRRERHEAELAARIAPEVARQVAPEVQKFLAFGGRAQAPIRVADGQRGIRVRLFIDYPNFLRGWRDEVEKSDRLDWERLPARLLDEVAARVGWDRKDMHLEAVEVYDSYVPFDLLAARGVSLPEAFAKYGYRSRQFLMDELSQLPGYVVHISDRKPRWDPESPTGMAASSKLVSREEGVDTGLMTDLFVQALNDTYDVALLLSDDADYISAVTALQARFSKKIVHAGFGGPGNRLRRACWAHIAIDTPLAVALKQRKPWVGTANGLAEEDVDIPQPPASVQAHVGKVLRGKIKNIQDYGAFVGFPEDTGLPDGLLYKGEIVDGMDFDAALRTLSVGQEVFVKIMSIPARGPRLTMKLVDQKTGKEAVAT